MSRQTSATARPEVLCHEAVTAAQALVRDGHLPVRTALRHVASIMATLWHQRGGPAAIEENPTAYPRDRAVLRSLGWSVEAEMSVEEAIGVDPTAGGCAGCGQEVNDG